MPKQEDELKRSLRVDLCDQAVAIRDRRRLVEEKMLRSRRHWMGANTGSYHSTDEGSEQYNSPMGRRVLERSTTRITKLLTPSVKWFEVSPMGDVPQERLSNVDSFMWYVIRKKIRSRSNINQLARCMLMYGRPILKTSVAVTNGQVWPTQRAVDPFAFYTFPETAPTIEECEVVFEDYLMSYERYITFVQMGILDEYPRDSFTAPKWPYHLTERLAYQGITDPGNNLDLSSAVNRISGELERSGSGFVSATEMWKWREDRLYQIYILWNMKGGPKICGFFQSAYEQPLYRSTIHRQLPGETYTNCTAEDIDPLDVLQNDMFNMFIDAVKWEQGIAAMDVSDGDNLRSDKFKMKGRAKWDFNGDPREKVLFLSPQNTSNNLLKTFQVVWGLLQGIGGNGGLAEGYPGRNMPRAGFAAQSLIDLGMADIEDPAEMIEQEVLTPGLGDIYKVSSFIPDTQLMRIPGGKALYGQRQSNVIRKQDLTGDFEFDWVGSLQFQDENVRAQRLMVFANMLGQPQIQQALAQQGVMVNWGELIPMIWRYGLGERGLNKILIQAPPPPMPSLNPNEEGAEQQAVPQGRGMPGMVPQIPQVTANGFSRA